MHASSLENMQKCYERYVCGEYFQSKQVLTVLDIGGANVNGSYADIFSQKKFKYIAADLSVGDGVDVVLDDPYKLPFNDNSVDILVSGQAFEHVEFFWLLFEEMVRVLKEDGFIFLIAPSSGGIHRFPVDCYRFYPDSYHALAKYTNIHAINVFHDNRGPWQDLVGVFSKTKKNIQSNFSIWQGLAKNEINKFLLERLPVSTNLERQSDEVEYIQGKSNYLQILKILHQKLKPLNYTEIGIRKGNSLALAECSAIAIDPEPEIDINQFNQCSLYKMPSDHFFEYHSKVLEQQAIDLAFIDGMHLFEFVLRDFINIEAHSCDSTVVVIDDVFPNHIQQASRKRNTQVWTGDVWKIIICLKKYRPDLNIITLDCKPTGLLIVTGLKKHNKTLVDQYNPLVRQISQLSIENYQQLIIQRSEAVNPEGSKLDRFLEALIAKKSN